ncbi:MAG: FHA domain-containing protein [Tannerellaceae bacterium]|jgi:pSer/pThr/pTyr-binding forkhead associated (FHA) protein|nr:FHA domain-containing protein [Tannerellaceae bacterium]
MRVITIGRDDSCDIVINNPRVSRVHANIFKQGQGYVYRDSSSNGTRINGIMLHQSDMRIMPGDSVLLADIEPLPWHKVQNLLPNNETEEVYYGSSARPPQAYGNPTALLIFGYLFALMGGLLGVVLGLILANSSRTLPNGSKVPKYSPSAVTNGWIIFSLSIIFGLVWLIVSANS